MSIMRSQDAMLLAALSLCLGWSAMQPGSASAWNQQTATSDAVQAQRISDFVAAQDWLGPVSAVALSPFFGLACLSGIATYGPDWIRNTPFLSVSGPLNNPILFWSMAMLTIATSLPRWTKFSKPIAMALEKVEAYSAIIILLVIRFAANAMDPPSEMEVAVTDPQWIAVGGLSLPLEILMSIALAINVVVVNTVKLVFDFLIWLTPIPAVDVVLDMVNKLICGGLISLYAFSPTLATLINLGIFLFCAIVFFTAKRATVYFRDIYIRSAIEKVLGTPASPSCNQHVFLAERWNGYPRRTHAILVQASQETTPQLIIARWFSTRRFDLQASDSQPTAGLLADSLVFNTGHGPVSLEARKGIFSPLELKQPGPLIQEI
jgi:hypothetical protein